MFSDCKVLSFPLCASKVSVEDCVACEMKQREGWNLIRGAGILGLSTLPSCPWGFEPGLPRFRGGLGMTSFDLLVLVKTIGCKLQKLFMANLTNDANLLEE